MSNYSLFLITNNKNALQTSWWDSNLGCLLDPSACHPNSTSLLTLVFNDFICPKTHRTRYNIRNEHEIIIHRFCSAITHIFLAMRQSGIFLCTVTPGVGLVSMFSFFIPAGSSQSKEYNKLKSTSSTVVKPIDIPGQPLRPAPKGISSKSRPL